MENPATWGRAEKIVNRALTDAMSDHARGVIGLSTARRITDALKQAGLLSEYSEDESYEDTPENNSPWGYLRGLLLSPLYLCSFSSRHRSRRMEVPPAAGS